MIRAILLTCLLTLTPFAFADPIVEGTLIMWDYPGDGTYPPYHYTDGTVASMKYWEVELRASMTVILTTFTIPMTETQFAFGDEQYAPAAMWEDTRYIYLRGVTELDEVSNYARLGPINDPVITGGGGDVLPAPVITGPLGGPVVYAGPGSRLEWTHPGTDGENPDDIQPEGSGLAEFQLQFLDDTGKIIKQYTLPPEARFLEFNTVSQHMAIYDARIRAVDNAGNTSPWTEFDGMLRIDREAPPPIGSLDVNPGDD